MSRACLLSAGGDVFLLSFVVSLWRRYWYNEVDAMYVCYNSPMEKAVVDELFKKLVGDKKLHLIYHPTGLGWGRPITEMVQIAQEDLVMLLEDDGFIYTPGIVKEQFDLIESGVTDAVGSPRFSCGMELAEAAMLKYGLDYSGEGDVGPHYWPNFFFAKRSDLLKTDLNFGSKSWQPGEYSKEVDHTFREVTSGDTFVWGCIQLRHQGVRFHHVRQHHASPNEIEEQKLGTVNWQKGNPPWLHGGSLSSGWTDNGFLRGGHTIPEDPGGRMELETRCALWTLVSDAVTGFDGLRPAYKTGIEQLINQGLNRGRINKKIEIYKGLMHI